VRLSAAPSGLASGTPCAVEVVPSLADPALLVPAEAVVEADRGAAHLWIVPGAGGVPQRIPVRVRAITGAGVRLEGALPEGMLVVTTGAELLRAGETVAVLP
jgi:multidrug efflux pump subunit AcrA (membrane-fusion protein)